MAASKELKNLYYVAELARQAERYDDMVEAMRKVAKMGKPLSSRGMMLLYLGYRNVMGARRASLVILSSFGQRGNEQAAEWIKELRRKVESELVDICCEVIKLIDEHLLPACTCTTGEPHVYYLKMKGDYYRYLAEWKTGSDRKEVVDLSLKAYEAAASVDLHATNHLRLALALNFSVFYYEIMNSPERAKHLAIQAYDEAILAMYIDREKPLKHSRLIIQQLKNITHLFTLDKVEDAVAEDAVAEDVVAVAEDAESHSDGAKRIRGDDDIEVGLTM